LRLPLAWLVFGITAAIFAGGSFINRPSREWLVFWGPVCYVIAASQALNPIQPFHTKA
jgi:hypothetical protein